MSQFWNIVYERIGRTFRAAIVCCLATTLWQEQCLGQTLQQPPKSDGTSGQATTTISEGSGEPKQTLTKSATAGSPEPQLLQRIEELKSKSRLYEAVPFAKELLEISEKRYGPEHTNTAIALDRLGEVLFEAQNFTNSASLHTRALEIREHWLGSGHPDTATTLENLAKARYGLGDYSGGLTLTVRSLSIRERVFGAQHPKTADALALLASLHCAIGNYVKAETSARRSLQIYTDVMGSKHHDTASALNRLGLIYCHMGNYTKAESLYQESLTTLTQLFGPEDPKTLASLNNLATLYNLKGEYAKADPLFDRSLAAFEKLLHSNPLGLATALDNRSKFYCGIGNYSKGLPLSERALKLRERVMGPEHPDTALSAMSLALLYEQNGDYIKTEEMFQRGLKIYESAFGPEHPQTATALRCLMLHYMNLGMYSNAMPLCVRSLKIREKSLGPEHPETADALSAVGRLFISLGGHKHAEPFFERSLAINEKAYGMKHPNTANTLGTLVFLKVGLGKLLEAGGLARKCKSAAEAAIFGILAYAPEQQRMQSQGPLSLSLLSVLAAAGGSVELSESVLRVKGAVMDSILEDEAMVLAAKEPSVAEAFDELRAASRRLTRAQIPPFYDSQLKSPGMTIPEQRILAERVEALQKQIARNVTSLGQVRRGSRVTVADVQGALANDTVLIEFFRYGHFLGKSSFESRYGAVVIGNRAITLGGANVGEPIWLSLDSARLFDQNIQEYCAMMRGTKKGDPAILGALYTQLFDRIQSRLPRETSKLIISADGQLNFVNFGTLVDNQGRFLTERFSIRYVASGRDMLFEPAERSGFRRYAAFANPSFSERPSGAELRHANDAQMIMQPSDRRDCSLMTLGALPNTSLEAQYLRDRSAVWRLQGAIHIGAEASELKVKSVKSPYILHIATHGFFLPADLSTNQSGIHGPLANEQRRSVEFGNPMHRSGLAFAGAQLTIDAWKRGEAPDSENDGILMAQEVRTMELRDTWLVVLSACDTGIGEARNGEGVLGLRRGFVQAGAQNLLMTLWPISDKWSVEIMKAFYEKAMASGNAPQAMADVQAEWLAKLRKEKGALLAARIAGPFVLTSRGKPISK